MKKIVEIYHNGTLIKELEFDRIKVNYDEVDFRYFIIKDEEEIAVLTKDHSFFITKVKKVKVEFY